MKTNSTEKGCLSGLVVSTQT